MLSLEAFKKKMSAEHSVAWEKDLTPEFFWCFKIAKDQHSIWRCISDTSRFNRELGLAARQQIEKDGKVIVRTTTIGIPQEWEERPWTWTAESTLGTIRHYHFGMAKRVQALFHIEPQETSNCVYVYFGWEPRNFLWSFFLRVTQNLLKRNFQKVFDKIETAPTAQEDSILIQTPPPMPEDRKKLLIEIQLKLTEQMQNRTLVEKFCHYIEASDDLELESIRLVPLAKKWAVDLREMVVLALYSTRLGLLNISWQAVCPHCRGSRKSAATLGDIPSVAECTVCDVVFSTGEQESIEIVFHVHPSVRKVEELLYCAAEPAKKNHIRLQMYLIPNQSLRIPLKLKPGVHRARLGKKQLQSFQVKESTSSSRQKLDFNHFGDVISVGTDLLVEFHHTGSAPELFVIEEMWWHGNALKPAFVLNIWEFRDLFSEEHLGSDVKLYLGEQTILFTDIVGSTKFYQQVGDAKAFSEVRNHFQEVFTEIKKENGVVVKTVGDAVMAAFNTIDSAVKAAEKIQQRFHLHRSDTPIRLRVSVHSGMMIAVQLNTGIDYFGNTVNVAAKIQAHANSAQVAISEKIYANCVSANHSILGHATKKQHYESGTDEFDVYVFDVQPAISKATKSAAAT